MRRLQRTYGATRMEINKWIDNKRIYSGKPKGCGQGACTAKWNSGRLNVAPPPVQRRRQGQRRQRLRPVPSLISLSLLNLFFFLSVSLSLAFFILRRSFLSQFNSKNCNVGNLSFLPFFSLEEEVWELIKLSEWLGLVLIYLLYGCVILSINLSVVCVWCMGHLIEAAIALNRRWQMRLVSLSSC